MELDSISVYDLQENYQINGYQIYSLWGDPKEIPRKDFDPTIHYKGPPQGKVPGDYFEIRETPYESKIYAKSSLSPGKEYHIGTLEGGFNSEDRTYVLAPHFVKNRAFTTIEKQETRNLPVSETKIQLSDAKRAIYKKTELNGIKTFVVGPPLNREPRNNGQVYYHPASTKTPHAVIQIDPKGSHLSLVHPKYGITDVGTVTTRPTPNLAIEGFDQEISKDAFLRMKVAKSVRTRGDFKKSNTLDQPEL